MVMCCSLPVPRSFAETFTMPLASISNVTSICGTPRRAGAMPSRWKRPRLLFVGGHLTLALQDVDLNGGLVVGGGGEDLALLGRGWWCCARSGVVHTPPIVSMPRDRGVTSSSSRPLTSPASTPACMRGADGDALVGVDALEGLACR